MPKQGSNTASKLAIERKPKDSSPPKMNPSTMLNSPWPFGKQAQARWTLLGSQLQMWIGQTRPSFIVGPKQASKRQLQSERDCSQASPKYVELVRPANLNLAALFKNVSPEVLFANTKTAPEKYSSEKRKWLGRIRMKKFYWLFTWIHNGLCDGEGFIIFNARQFEKTVGSSFARTCRVILENLHVIECRFDPHLGLTFLWVRLTPQYQNQPQVRAIFKL